MRSYPLRVRRRIRAWPSVALLLALVVSPLAALAQGGASCLFECDAKCYGIPGPYCRSGCMAQCNSRAPSTALPQSYGSAYATSDGSGAYGFSFGFGDQYSAMDEAKKRCQKQGSGPCQRLIIFANRCASVIYAKRGDDILGISGSAEPRQADADAKGLALCRRENPAASCEIAEQFCSK
jgi:Domain of unknown function (DUF4189)